MSTAGTKRQWISIEEIGDVTIVRFTTDKLVERQDINAMSLQLFELVKRGDRKKVLVSFRGLGWMSSPMFSTLHALKGEMASVGGSLRLSNIRPEIYAVFEITKAHRKYVIDPDETAAIAAFTA